MSAIDGGACHFWSVYLLAAGHAAADAAGAVPVGYSQVPEAAGEVWSAHSTVHVPAVRGAAWRPTAVHHRQVGERRRSRGRCVSAGSTFGVLTHSAVVGPVVLQWFHGKRAHASAK